MAAKRRGPPVAARDLVRIGIGTAQIRQQIGADALDRFRVEAGRGQRQVGQLECLVLLVEQRAQRTVELVAGRRETQADRARLELFVKRAGVEIAGALVDQPRHQRRDASLVGRILARAATERKIDGNQRRRRRMHQPRLDAERTDNALDLGGGARRHHQRDSEGREGCDPQAQRAPSDQDFFSSGLGHSLIR
jgi:hypothetical protein